MKVGLSLGGGGAKGAYQIGVLRALEESGLIRYVNMISGVSIGAINAYFYLSGKKAQTVYDAWLYAIKNNPFKQEGIFPRYKDSGGFYNMDIVKEISSLFLDEKAFKKSKKDLYIVLTKVEEPQIFSLLKKTSRKKVVVHLNKKENPLDFVISSASIPFVFGFQEIKGDYFVDGGISDNNPIDVLVDKGANVIFHSSFQKGFDLDKYKDKDITLIELTSMYAMPYFRLSRFLSSVDMDMNLFERRVKYGYYVTKSMIKYLLEEKVLIFKDNKYHFKKQKEKFNNITIPDEIHQEVKRMYKEKE